MTSQITGVEFLLWILKRRRRITVVNHSMQPTFNSGDEILVNFNAYRSASPQINDVVVLADPREAARQIVKRITDVDGDRYYLRGDNPSQSTDSRQFGWVERHQIQGKVTCVFAAVKSDQSEL